MSTVHEYETDIHARQYSRPFAEECAIAFSALDCVLNGEKGIYASSELTTGGRAYELLAGNGFRSTGQLSDPHRSALLKTNMEEASRFAARLREELGGREMVITPAHFDAPGWTQAEYLAFWEELIRTRVKAVWFNDGWEYSNGCTFELAVAVEAGVATYDAHGRPLSREHGIGFVERAIADLEARGFDTARLRINLARLSRGMSADDAAERHTPSS
jgi:hypothetical protein